MSLCIRRRLQIRVEQIVFVCLVSGIPSFTTPHPNHVLRKIDKFLWFGWTSQILFLAFKTEFDVSLTLLSSSMPDFWPTQVSIQNYNFHTINDARNSIWCVSVAHEVFAPRIINARSMRLIRAEQSSSHWHMHMTHSCLYMKKPIGSNKEETVARCSCS